MQLREKLTGLEGQRQSAWFGFIHAAVLLLGPINTVRCLRVSGIWKEGYQTMDTGPGSRSESKRKTRYAEKHPKSACPWGCTKLSLIFPGPQETGKRHLLCCLISSLPRSLLSTGCNCYIQHSNNMSFPGDKYLVYPTHFLKRTTIKTNLFHLVGGPLYAARPIILSFPLACSTQACKQRIQRDRRYSL